MVGMTRFNSLLRELALIDRLPALSAQLLLRRARRVARSGRLDQAEAILSRARKWFRRDLDVAVNQAFLAEIRGDADELLRRWQAIQRDFPDAGISHAGLAAALRKQGQIEAAAAILDEAASRFAEASEIASEQAWLALDRGEIDEAIGLWTAFMARFPDNPSGYIGACSARPFAWTRRMVSRKRRCGGSRPIPMWPRNMPPTPTFAGSARRR
jgi:tetratricopeptide (TPR) repeat protein